MGTSGRIYQKGYHGERMERKGSGFYAIVRIGRPGCIGIADGKLRIHRCLRPKICATVHAIERKLNDGLLYRYKNKDDFGLPSSSFTICTFWFINSLYKIGETKKAEKLFEQLLSYSNHLGLFS